MRLLLSSNQITKTFTTPNFMVTKDQRKMAELYQSIMTTLRQSKKNCKIIASLSTTILFELGRFIYVTSATLVYVDVTAYGDSQIFRTMIKASVAPPALLWTTLRSQLIKSPICSM